MLIPAVHSAAKRAGCFILPVRTIVTQTEIAVTLFAAVTVMIQTVCTGALACMAGCFYTGCKKLMQTHKYFACGSLVCMGMAIYSGHKIAPKKKKAEKPEK